MTNEKTNFEEFRSRALKLRPDARSLVLELAWKECAWTARLTDERICREIDSAAHSQALRAGINAAETGVTRGEAYEIATTMPMRECDAYLAGYYGRLRRAALED